MIKSPDLYLNQNAQKILKEYLTPDQLEYMKECGVDKNEFFKFDPYLAPEQIFKKMPEQSCLVDSWTYGMIMYFLFFGTTPAPFLYQLLEFDSSIMKQMESFSTPSPS